MRWVETWSLQMSEKKKKKGSASKCRNLDPYFLKGHPQKNSMFKPMQVDSLAAQQCRVTMLQKASKISDLA